MERLLLRCVEQPVPQDAKSGITLHHAGSEMSSCAGNDDRSSAHEHRVSHGVDAFALAAVPVRFSVQAAGARFIARKGRDFGHFEIEFRDMFRGQIVHPDAIRLLVGCGPLAHLAAQGSNHLPYTLRHAGWVGPGGVCEQRLAAALMAVGAIEDYIRFVPDIHAVPTW